MRLTAQQTQIILEAVSETFGQNAQVILFGSRTSNYQRGGDIDLLITTSIDDAVNALKKKIALLNKLEKKLGERKIDIVIEMPNDDRPIVRIAHAMGLKL